MPNKFQIKLIASGVVSLLLTGSAAAQCAMCRATLAGNPQAAAASHQMNMAVLLLLIPAIVMFTGFFVLMYRYRNSFRNSPPDTGPGSSGHDEFDFDELSGLRGPVGPQWS
jgi:heme/copper-type cytochrome/quinol oxidase subunit 2